jgi:hypothetical protein
MKLQEQDHIVVMENLLWKNSVTVVGGNDRKGKTVFAVNVAAHVRAGQNFLKDRFRVPEPRSVSYTCTEGKTRAVFNLLERCQKSLGVLDLDIPIMSINPSSGLASIEVISDLPTPAAMSDTVELRVMDIEYPGSFLDGWAQALRFLARPDAANPDGIAVLVVSPGSGKIPQPLYDAADTVLTLSEESEP